MNRQHCLILCLCLFIAGSNYAQRDQGGFISPRDSLKKILPLGKIIYLPQDGFTFLEAPHGPFKGKILPGPPLYESGYDSLMTATITGAYIRPQLLGIENFFETYDSLFHLPFDLQTDNHLRILYGGYTGWISLEEITKKGFELTYWMEFYGETKGRMIRPREKIASIRVSPYPDADIIEMADELYSEISTTGKCEGSFCKVNVVQYKNPYDASKTKEENIQKKYTGWIRIIDDNGQPMVAHHSQGT